MYEDHFVYTGSPVVVGSISLVNCDMNKMATEATAIIDLSRDTDTDTDQEDQELILSKSVFERNARKSLGVSSAVTAQSSKRKDFTPKKEEDSLERKKQVTMHIDLTEDEYGTTTVRKKAARPLFIKEEKDEKMEISDAGATGKDSENEKEGDDSDSTDQPLAFYRNDIKLPVYSKDNPDLPEIFRICVKKDVPQERLVKQKPVRIKDKVTFIVNQTLADIKHPKDLEADDTPGAYIKKESTRFYQLETGEDGELNISSEVNITKDAGGIPVSGEYRKRNGRVWETISADMKKVHAVIRKRAVHKATLECYNTAFTRCITWVMPLEEYTRVYAKMRDMKNCVLLYSNIIMHYYFNTGQQVPIVAEKHGNAKRQNAPDFRPKEHSLKQSCKELVKQDFRAPRLICQEMQEKEDVLESITDAPLIRDPKQISNYRQRYGSQKSRKDNDAIRDVIFGLLEQSDNEERDLLDKDQPFIQELLIRHGKQAAIVGYLQQTLKDVERFCTAKGNPLITSPLSVDTTFNIAEYLVTQTTYRQCSILDRKSLKHPWFPGPLMFHRNQAKDDFAFLWQAVKRGNSNLSSLLVLGTDEDEALSGGILQEVDETIHLLGKEHVYANIEKKLVDLNFPIQQRRVILKDIFEGPESLYESPSDGNYLQKVAVLKEKWRGIEEEFTKNRPPCKFNKYFEVYKENQIRTKMILTVRREAKVEGEYGQNPIEWQNFLTKEEIDDFCKRDGEGHSDVSITTALAALKNRYLRLYQNVVRAVYDEGPYMLSPPFSQFAVSYDEWKSMSKEERSRHMKSFMSYVPTPAVLRRLEDGVVATSLRDDANANTKSCESQKEGPRRLLLTAVEANIPVGAVDASTLQDIFKKAEFLLNEPGAIMKAASSDERMRTVKSRYGSMPLIVKPQPKNRVLLDCTCKLYKALHICPDTVAVAEDNGILFEYIEALRKKLQRNKRVPNLTAAIESNLSISQRGHKPNEVQKLARRTSTKKQESFASTSQTQAHSLALPCHQPQTPLGSQQQLSSSGHLMQQPQSSLSQQSHSQPQSSQSYQSQPQLPLPYHQPQLQSTLGYQHQQTSSAYSQFMQPPPLSQSYHQPLPYHQPQIQAPLGYQQQLSCQSQSGHLMQQPQSSLSQQPQLQSSQSDYHQPQQLGSQWHAGLSPHPYTLCELPAAAKKCYGCSEEFSAKYRKAPYITNKYAPCMSKD